VLRSPCREEFTRISFYRERGYRDNVHRTGAMASVVAIDSSYASTAADVRARIPEIAQFPMAPEESLRLRVFVDRSVVEVFVNGIQCLAVRVYPEREDSIGVSMRAQGSECELRSLDVWQMDGIY